MKKADSTRLAAFSPELCVVETKYASKGHVPGTKNDLFIKDVKDIVLLQGMFVESLEALPAGSLVGIAGIDQFLVRSGTLTDSDTTHSIRTIRCSVAPVVQVAVGVRKPAQLLWLIEGMKWLSKSHSHVQTWVSETGEHIIAGGDGHQLETWLEVSLAVHEVLPRFMMVFLYSLWRSMRLGLP